MIGIRHEEKSRWEARVPLVPQDVGRLARQHGVRFRIQRSATRCFGEAEYAAAGAEIADRLDECPVILGVKEIPIDALLPGRSYLFFSHTIKGQRQNMPTLRRLMELRCQLIDYERITDAHGRRLVFFGDYAGLAGMIDSLWALGRRLDHEGITTPFSAMRPAHGYADLGEARKAVARVGEQIRTAGLAGSILPFVCGFAGYGRVSTGAQQIYDLLPVEEIAPSDLSELEPDPQTCYKVVFREEHLVEKGTGTGRFELQNYYDHPEAYRSRFAAFAEKLSILINGIYWEPRYPRLLTRTELARIFAPERFHNGPPPSLRVIGDISCDIEGSLACTLHATSQDDPVFVYDAATREAVSGVVGNGPVVLAVDNLPCELALDSSRHFSSCLAPFIHPLARADVTRPLEDSGLPAELQHATVLWQGELTPAFRYLEAHL